MNFSKILLLFMVGLVSGCAGTSDFQKRKHLPGKYRQKSGRYHVKRDIKQFPEVKLVAVYNPEGGYSESDLSKTDFPDNKVSDTLVVLSASPNLCEKESQPTPVTSEAVQPSQSISKQEKMRHHIHPAEIQFQSPITAGIVKHYKSTRSGNTPIALKIFLLFIAVFTPTFAVISVCGAGNRSLAIFVMRTIGVILLLIAILGMLGLSTSPQLAALFLTGAILMVSGIILGIAFMVHCWEQESM